MKKLSEAASTNIEGSFSLCLRMQNQIKITKIMSFLLGDRTCQEGQQIEKRKNG
jgi:hypothetical protein